MVVWINLGQIRLKIKKHQRGGGGPKSWKDEATGALVL